jgi:hypothetical protein
MRLMALAVAAAFAATAIATADAAPRKRRVVQQFPPHATPAAYTPRGTLVVHRDEAGRTRTKIIVQKRSYLDGGTEVMPGDNIDAYRSSFLTHRTSEGLGRNDITNPVGPIPGPFYLPGKNNPWPGFMD